jgi:hypothetical protein
LQGVQLTAYAPWRIRITATDEERLKGRPGAGESTAELAARWGLGEEIILKKIQSGELQAERCQQGRRSRWITDTTGNSTRCAEQLDLLEYDSGGDKAV